MIESISREALHNAMPQVEALLQRELPAFASYEVNTFDLAYVITALDG
jgi:hypothetical protein